MASTPQPHSQKTDLRPLPKLIFASRWLQLPLYLGLILAQGVYVFHFWVELVHLLEAVFGSQTALQALISGIGYKVDAPITQLNETIIMLVVLALIDVVMISNLLIMVIVGGYETFVSRMDLESQIRFVEFMLQGYKEPTGQRMLSAIKGSLEKLKGLKENL